MIYIKLLIIQLIIVFIVDISGFIEDGIEPMLSRVFKMKNAKLRKPLNCSLCLTTWIGLLYLLVTWQISIYTIGYVFLLAMMTPTANNMLLAIKDLIDRIITKIDRIL